MTKEPSFEEQYPHLREFQRFLDALNHESERGAALVSVAMIDGLLEKTIQAFLVDHEDTKKLLEGFNAPLGTFAARTLAGLALGLLSEAEYKECRRLGRVRNIFAHNVHASFEIQKIRDLCSDLEFAVKDPENDRISARGKYTTAASSLILNLTNRAHYASQRRLTYRMWKY